MEALETPFTRVQTSQLPRYVGILTCIHLVLMLIVLVLVGVMVPELGKTLDDVNVMVPKMSLTLVELGRMLPEIRDGMKILDALCEEAPQCTV